MEYHDVMVIDESKSKVESITDRLNVSGICGAGASRETLMRAENKKDKLAELRGAL